MFSEALLIKELLTPNGKYFKEDLFLEKEPSSYFTYGNVALSLYANVDKWREL